MKISLDEMRIYFGIHFFLSNCATEYEFLIELNGIIQFNE